MRENHLENFKTYLNDKIGGFRARIKQELSRAKGNIDLLEENIKAYRSKIQDILRAEKTLDDKSSKDIDEIRKMFKQATEIDGIRGISIKNSEILIFTENIYINLGDDIYDIGKFRISITIHDYECIVNFINLDRTVRGFNHPHIGFEGGACLGEIDNTVADLTKEFRLPELCVTLLIFLRSVNPDDDWGMHVYDWPRVA